MKEKSLFLFKGQNGCTAVLVNANSYLKIRKLSTLGFKHIMDTYDMRHVQQTVEEINPTFMTYSEMNKIRKKRGL